ncbi:acyl-homoserine-lactone synthase [Mesorhizobium sp. WSM3868]|uniref:acyl-homoserine-lactone synthase n=1 Tax=Mesorhizobium sp. WSM3868 TaxID=2029405 RepID=UPI000BAF53FC|nr:acyl-homoserine-lactone synthase [Mesorhizobium sp. WSM3868]PBB39845.1 conjugal transfer protein TraI [Mesorhizobium sp. WSM3868]
MIELIAPGWYGAFDELHEMHRRLRYHVLKERLGWKVRTTGGFEIGSFEALKPHYLVLRGSAGRVGGGVRPLPSTGPTMLPDVFSTLLEGRTTPGYGFAHGAKRRMAARPDRSAPDIGTTRAIAPFWMSQRRALLRSATWRFGGPVLWAPVICTGA